jgi:hypothetical protein
LIDVLLDDPPVEQWQMYVPVLRAKSSEFKALGALSRGTRRRIIPIIEFVPDWKSPGSTRATGRRRAPQTPAEYVQRMLDSSAHATPWDGRSFVYFGHAGADGLWKGIDLWEAFEARATILDRVDLFAPAEARASAGPALIPLVDLSCAERSPSLVRVTRRSGAAGLRVLVADVDAGLGKRIADALRTLGVPAASAHIIVDLKDHPGAASHGDIRSVLVTPGEFASIVVLAGVFPRDLMEFDYGKSAVARREWQSWWKEHASKSSGDRPLGFGDYTTSCAHYQAAPSVPASVSLRYTTDHEILVFRGRQSDTAKGFANDQMTGHCRLLLDLPEYDGAGFSWGDQRIYCWAQDPRRPGNAEQWRAAAIVHHVTHVVVQLHDPLGSSAAARKRARAHVLRACA